MRFGGIFFNGTKMAVKGSSKREARILFYNIIKSDLLVQRLIITNPNCIFRADDAKTVAWKRWHGWIWFAELLIFQFSSSIMLHLLQDKSNKEKLQKWYFNSLMFLICTYYLLNRKIFGLFITILILFCMKTKFQRNFST